MLEYRDGDEVSIDDEETGCLGKIRRKQKGREPRDGLYDYCTIKYRVQK